MWTRPHVALVSLCAVCPAAFADLPPTATVRLRTDNGPAVRLTVAGEWIDAEQTVARYVGSSDDPEGTWHLEWDYTVDVQMADDNASLDGQMTVLNSTAAGALRQFTASFDVRLLNAPNAESTISGQASIEFAANQNGGLFEGGDNMDYICCLTLDGEIAKGLWSSGTAVELEEEGSSSMSQVFGWPFPENALIGPTVKSCLGARHQFKITDGDSASLGSLFYVSAP
jgi:hypothetical protein